MIFGSRVVSRSMMNYWGMVSRGVMNNRGRVVSWGRGIGCRVSKYIRSCRG